VSVEVTVRDTETGESQTATITDDYVLICEGSCRLDRTQVSANGTAVLTVKGRKQAQR
jgi:hypothetical protein